MAYWDLIFNDDPAHSRDSSASAIAVCGILEMIKYLPAGSEADKKYFAAVAAHILKSLSVKYAVYETVPGAPILYHGVYS